MKPVPYCGLQNIRPTVQNLVVWAIWRPGFVHPYYIYVSGPRFEPEHVEQVTTFYENTDLHTMEPFLLASEGMETLALISACDMEHRCLVLAFRVKFLLPPSWCSGHILPRIWR